MAEAMEKRGGGFIGFVTGRWFLSAVGTLAFALILWFLGPFLPVLADVLPRVLFVAIVVLVWLIANLLFDVHAAKRNSEMIAKVADASSDRALASERDAAEEVSTLRKRLEEALIELRKSQAATNKKRQYLYELPWYILIGPPGSGKTTALINSGLKFPLSAKFGKDPLRGVGGTRNCDWWFSDDAILLDTAGRYTTQDSNQAVDHKAWLGFLRLLKQFRPRQPINGVMVAIGLPELIQMSAEARSQHARAIKDRLNELQREFGLRLPVYVFLTKADMLSGFVEFFGDLDRDDRAKVWGSTYRLDIAKDSAAIDDFDAEFDLLVQRLNDRLLDRINEERDSERRARIFGFPMQFATLKGMLRDFLSEIFAPNRFEQRPLLRGTYFTSATQQGAPIDRLMTAMANTFGIADQRPAAFSGQGRSYFVTRLLREVVFGEASLAGADPKVERRNRVLHYAALCGIAAIAVLLIGAWTVSYYGNRDLIVREEAAIADYRKAAEPIAYDTTVTPPVQKPVADDEVASVMPALDQLRALPAGYDSAKQGAPLSRRFGLNESPTLEKPAIAAYRDALNGLLLPRLLYGLQAQLGNNINNPDFVGTIFPIYLMLSGDPHMDKPRVKAILMSLYGARAYPDLGSEQALARFGNHLDALLEVQLPVAARNDDLMARAREVYANVPIPTRAYNVIKNSPEATRLAMWTVSSHVGGTNADQVLMRLSGKPLTDGIPGFFGYAGFHSVLLPQIPDAIRKATEEAAWVTGMPVAANPSAVRALSDQTADIYARDFILNWDQLLADVTIRPFRTNLEGAALIRALSGPASPFKAYMQAASEETTMNRPAPQGVGAGGGAGGAAAQAILSGGGIGGALAAAGGVGDSAARAIDDHYRPLHQFLAGTPSQFDGLLQQLATLSNDLSNPNLPPGGGGAMAQVAAQAASLPPPLNAMVAKVAGGTAGVTKSAIQALYASTVLPFCQQAVNGRYPFAPASTQDVLPGDFQQMFSPGGRLDTFFNTNLKSYVDTRPPWRNQKVNNTDLGLSSGALAQFERAQRIRNAFFPAGGATLMLEFTLVPLDLMGDAKEVSFDADGGQVLTMAKGAQGVPLIIKWPAANAIGRARVIFTNSSGQMTSIEKTGSWALFRLLDSGRPAGRNEQYTLTYNAGGMTARFLLRASNVNNPIGLREPFQCPPQL